MMRCPTCRRTAEPDAVACSRCGTDLAALAQLRRAAGNALAQGRCHLRSGEPEAAAACLRSARRLQYGPESAAGLALAALLRRDFPQALRWHARAVRGLDTSE